MLNVMPVACVAETGRDSAEVEYRESRQGSIVIDAPTGDSNSRIIEPMCVCLSYSCI